jgi:excisionase family DNA binding protein
MNTQPPIEPDDVVDVRGAMQLLNLGRNAVYQGCARNEIPHRRIGKLLRFSRAGLRSWLSSSTAISSSDRRARG